MFFEPQIILLKIVDTASKSTIDWVSLGTACISLLLASFTIYKFFTQEKRLKQEFTENFNLKQKEIENIINSQLLEIKSKYSEKLLEKRIELYPELIKITHNIGKNLPNKTGEEIKKNHEDAYEKLINWEIENGGTFYFNEKTTLKAFYHLEHVLNLRKIKYKSLDIKKLQSIRKKRDNFRKCLHDELKILQKHEKLVHYNG